jgi:hypothetical protein
MQDALEARSACAIEAAAVQRLSLPAGRISGAHISGLALLPQHDPPAVQCMRHGVSPLTLKQGPLRMRRQDER